MSANLFDFIAAGWLNKAIAVAARLGVADIVEDGPKTCEEIAAATNANRDVLLRLLRLLASHDVFEQCADGRFKNSALSETLRTGHELSIRHFYMLAGEEYYDAWAGLLHSVKTGEPAFPHVFGGSIYDHMDKNPEAARVYDLAMRDLARPVGFLLARRHDFTKAETIVDIGGGRGEMLSQILAVHKHASGICIDRADVCARAERDVDPTLAGRLRFAPGDFFEAVPAGGDIYILKNVLHNWNDESALRILRSVSKAIAADRAARLLVIEPLVEPDSTSRRGLMNALFQIVICEEGTRERTAADLGALLNRAGFEVVSTQILPTGHSVVECAQSA